MHAPSRNAPKLVERVAGMNQKPPPAIIARSMMMPPLHPSLAASQPAGGAIRK
jgi:hypothetical protein